MLSIICNIPVQVAEVFFIISASAEKRPDFSKSLHKAPILRGFPIDSHFIKIYQKGMSEMKYIRFSSEEERSFVRAMNIAYYNDFYKKGLISAEQLDMLLSIQKDS